MWRMRGLLALGTVAIAAALFTGQARAGYIVQPANGLTVGPRPTFLVYLDPSEQSLALVHVGTSASVDSSGFSADEIGSCLPTTPFGSEPHKFTCQPPGYSPSYGSSLAPGTYYWWMTYFATDPGSYFDSLHVSGPFQFTVANSIPPGNTGLLTPADGTSLVTPVRFQITAPAQATMHIYVGLDSERADDGSPLGLTIYSCGGQTANAGTYYCEDASSATDFLPGETYWWWAVIETGDGNQFVYGPRSFTIREPDTSGGSSGSSGSSAAHTLSDAPYLPSAARFSGHSIKQTRLSRVTYAVSKFIGAPKMMAVVCWSDRDWPSVSGDGDDGLYSTLAFWEPAMPHFIELSPRVCRAMETLLHHRPRYPNRFTANAVETLTHELMHALGIRLEAQAECYGMQLSIVMAVKLGIPYSYADKLAKLNLVNYQDRPPSYQNYGFCREGGRWDLFPSMPSPPWHSFVG